MCIHLNFFSSSKQLSESNSRVNYNGHVFKNNKLQYVSKIKFSSDTNVNRLNSFPEVSIILFSETNNSLSSFTDPRKINMVVYLKVNKSCCSILKCFPLGELLNHQVLDFSYIYVFQSFFNITRAATAFIIQYKNKSIKNIVLVKQAGCFSSFEQ